MTHTAEKVVYRALDRSLMKQDYSRLVLLVGALVLAFGIGITDPRMIVMGIVLMYITLYKKTVFLDGEGMTIYYNGVFYKKTRVYPFRDFDTLRVEAGNGIERKIGFVRKGVSYHTLFPVKEAEKVLNLALEANPDIRVVQYRAKKRGMI